MSEHKALRIAGYTNPSSTKLDLVNHNKHAEERILRICDALRSNTDVDQRQLSIAITQFEHAFMRLNRSIFQPTRIKLLEDDQSPEHRPNL